MNAPKKQNTLTSLQQSLAETRQQAEKLPEDSQRTRLVKKLDQAIDEATTLQQEIQREKEREKTLLETVRYTREELERKIEEISLVRLVSEMGIRCLLADDPLRFILQHVSQITEAEHGSLMLLDQASGRLYLAASHGPDRIPPYERSYKLGEGIANWVDQSHSGKPMPLDPTQAVLLRDSDPASGSFLCYPLIVERSLVGVLSIGHSRVDAFTDNTERVLYIIANQVALAVYNSNLLAMHKQQKDVLERSQDHYRSLIERVNDLLDLARLETGNLTYKKEQVRLREMLTGLRPQHKAQLRQKSIRMQVQIPKRIPTLKADAKRLEQALSILIQDAIRSTPSHGAIRLNISLEDDDPKRWSQVKLPAGISKFLLFALTDTAPQIPEPLRGSIFDQLKADPTQPPSNRAGRLSLYLAKEIIEAHKGQIWLESTQAEGNTFRFTIPVM